MPYAIFESTFRHPEHIKKLLLCSEKIERIEGVCS